MAEHEYGWSTNRNAASHCGRFELHGEGDRQRQQYDIWDFRGTGDSGHYHRFAIANRPGGGELLADFDGHRRNRIVHLVRDFGYFARRPYPDSSHRPARRPAYYR